MNLYIFNESSRAAVYGIGTYIRELTAALCHSRINVCVVHLKSGNPQIRIEETDGVRHWYFPAPVEERRTIDYKKQRELYYRNIVYLLQLHIEDKKGLIFHLNYNQSGKLAEELKKSFTCRVICGVHFLFWCFSLMGNMNQFCTLLEKSNVSPSALAEIPEYQNEMDIFNCADHILCLSRHTAGILREHYHLPAQKITVVYNGLTDNMPQNAGAALRQKYRIPVDIPVFLFVGRLDKIKGLEYVLRAFRNVSDKSPGCLLFIAGNGSYDTYLKECENMWMNIIFTGLIDKEKLYDFYTVADIGVMPSFHEQCSYVAIEMMMHGLPIIAGTSTGLKEMVEDGVTGLHIPIIEYPDKAEIDSSLLAEKMLYLLQNPNERKQMGLNARRRYESVYSSEIFRRNMLDFYQSLFQ